MKAPTHNESTDIYPGHDDLLDEFTSSGWSGDLRGALEDAPFHAVPPDRGDDSGDWRPLFRDYLRGLPDHTRAKYAIRDPQSRPESSR